MKNDISADTHVAIVKGDVSEKAARSVLVRVHSECLTGDAFGSCAATAATSLPPR